MIGVACTVVGVIALVTAYWKGWAQVPWVAKPLASGGFLITLAERGVHDRYGVAIAVALGLCALGDLLLIPRGAKRIFVAGLLVFLCGHLGLVYAFWTRGVDARQAALMAAGLLVPLLLVARWLLPRVKHGLRSPVMAYMVVITVMVATAAGSDVPAVVLPAVLAFYASDVFVAAERFVNPSPWNKTFGLPLYYLATQLLAWSV